MLRFLAAALIAMLPAEAVAGTKLQPENERPIPTSLHLQAKGDTMINLIRKIKCDAGSFRSTITVEKLLDPKKFQAAAVVEVYSDDEAKSLYIGTDNFKTPLGVSVTEHTEGHKIRNTRELGGKFQLGRPVQFEVTWTPKQVSYFINEKRQWAFRVDKPTDLVLMATGAVVKFDKNSMACDLIS